MDDRTHLVIYDPREWANVDRAWEDLERERRDRDRRPFT